MCCLDSDRKTLLRQVPIFHLRMIKLVIDGQESLFTRNNFNISNELWSKIIEEATRICDSWHQQGIKKTIDADEVVYPKQTTDS